MTLPLFKKLLITLTIGFPFILFLIFRVGSLSIDMSNSDAARWHIRSENFAHAIKSGNFAETYQRYHPGVTLMWLTTFVEWGIKFYDVVNQQEHLTLEHTEGYALIDGVSKLALVGALLILLILQFRYVDSLFDRTTALLYVIFVAIEPYFIGISRWYHLTALEVFLTMCALLTFILWAEYDDRRYLLRSGIFFGFALLTKFSSLFILPVFALIFGTKMLIKRQLLPIHYVQSMSSFVAGMLIIIVAFFPALWVEPFTVLAKIVSAGFNAGAGDYSAVRFAETSPALFYFFAFLYKSSPFLWVLFIFIIFRIKSLYENTTSRFVLAGFCIQFILLSLSEQKIERYLVVLFPLLILLGAYVLGRFSRYIIIPFVGFSLVYTLYVSVQYYPVYSAYYSPLLGGAKKAYELGLYDDSGEYFADAARYLNNKGRENIVMVPNNIQTFSYYYKGKSVHAYSPEVDYIVVSKDSRRDTFQLPSKCITNVANFYNQDLAVVTIYSCVK